jgi:hypothetical protein
LHPVRNQGRTETVVLYWFRTPPYIKVGRTALDAETRQQLEELYPDITFDWNRILREPPQPLPEREAVRRKEQRDAREARRKRKRPLETPELAEPAERSDLEEPAEPAPEREEDLTAEPPDETETDFFETAAVPTTEDSAPPAGSPSPSAPAGAGKRRRRRRRRKRPGGSPPNGSV